MFGEERCWKKYDQFGCIIEKDPEKIYIMYWKTYISVVFLFVFLWNCSYMIPCILAGLQLNNLLECRSTRLNQPVEFWLSILKLKLLFLHHFYQVGPEKKNSYKIGGVKFHPNYHSCKVTKWRDYNSIYSDYSSGPNLYCLLDSLMSFPLGTTVVW